MAKSVAVSKSEISTRKAFLWAVLLMAGLLLILFRKGLPHGMAIFSNDGPLGIIKGGTERLPEGLLKGVWLHLNWLGSHGISASPTISTVLATILGPFWFSKLYPAIALWLLGIATWTLFRKLGFNVMTCTLTGFA